MPRRAAASYGLPNVPGTKPSPPPDLSQVEIEIWNELTAGIAAERLDPQFAVLVQPLIRHIRYAKWLGAVIDGMMKPDAPKVDPDRAILRGMLTAPGAETGKVADLMGRLRLLPVNRYAHNRAQLRPSAHPEPWLDWTDDAGEKPKPS